MAAREYPNVVNVFFVLAPVWIEVKGGGVSHITSGIVRYNGDIITYFLLVRVAFEGIKRIAYRHVRRPGHASVGAEGIEKL